MAWTSKHVHVYGKYAIDCDAQQGVQQRPGIEAIYCQHELSGAGKEKQRVSRAAAGGGSGGASASGGGGVGRGPQSQY